MKVRAWKLRLIRNNLEAGVGSKNLEARTWKQGKVFEKKELEAKISSMELEARTWK